ncbi:MAG: energy-coupling factor transporter transmembrane component T [Anaerolineales bacterium]
MQRMHSFIWLVWIGLVLWIISLARNPFYLILLWIWIAIIHVYTRTREQTLWNSAWTLWASLGIVLMSAVFNLLTTHFGEHILFHIPGKIPLISGIATGEALVYGVTNGLVLSVMLNAFWTFNRNVPIRSLLRLIPRAFYSLAIISSIAVTFIPITIRQYQQIQEAQAVRGHRMNGVRDFLALIMPLLTSSLERAFQLAEVLTARGFHNPSDSAQNYLAQRWFYFAGLILIFLGWQWQWVNQHLPLSAFWVGRPLFLLGMIIFGFPFWRIGKSTSRSRYYADVWQAKDWFGLFSLLITTVGIGIFFLQHDPSLSYSPYPSLTLPLFNPWIGFCLAGLSVPAFLQGSPKYD